MKSLTAGIDLPVKSWSRHARHIVAFGVTLVGLGSAWGQNAVGTFAGTLGAGGAINNTAPGVFNFTSPSGIVADSAGNIFVADTNNNVIRKITPAGVLTTFAGSAAGTSGNGDGTGTAAFFNHPQGLAIDGANNLYVADTNNHAIRMITSAGVVTTLGGTAGGANLSVTVLAGYNNATGTSALFRSPLGIAADRAGGSSAALNVYVADTQNNVIRQIVVTTKAVTTLVGAASVGGAAAPSGNGNTGATSSFFHPDAIVSNAAGDTMYVADTFNSLIRKIVITAGPTITVSTFAGSGSAAYVEGTGTGASFNSPAGIALDGSGNLLVADTSSHVIRSINAGTGVTAQYAGTGNSSGSTNGLATTTARFNLPSGIAFDATTPAVFVVDTNNQTIRKISAAQAPGITTLTGNPALVSLALNVAAGASPTITVAATGNPPVSYQWQRKRLIDGAFSDLLIGDSTVSGITSATLTINSVTTGMNGDKYQVVVSNGFGSNATSSQVTLGVQQAPAFTSANSTTFTVGVQGTFNVTTTGTPTSSALQQLNSPGTFPSFASFNTNGSGGATIITSPSGPSAGDVSGSPYVFTIRANNGVGGDGSHNVDQTFTLTVAPAASPPTINTQPTDYPVPVGFTTASPAFSVTATGNPAISGYQWQKRQPDLVTFANLANDGVYANVTTAALSISSISPAMNGDVFHVLVTNAQGTTTSNNVTLTVLQVPVITSAASTTFVAGQSNNFSFTATGVPAPTFNVTGTLPSLVSVIGSLMSGNPPDTSNSPFTLSVSATNSAGTSSPQTFILTVSTASVVPVITVQPVGTTVNLSQNATFTSTATGSPTPSLRWQRQPAGTSGFVDLSDDATYSGTTGTTLTVLGVAAGMSGDAFRLSAVNTNGSVTSTAVLLTVNIGTAISTFAGAAGISGTIDGTGTGARFNTPSSIAADVFGNFYVADSANHVIRKISSTGVVTTVAGLPGSSGTSDGVGSAARFNGPSGVAVNSVGTVYVADTYNHTIRVVAADGTVTTLAGLAGNSGTANGVGNAARFAFPNGLTVDSSGNVFVADTANHAIRRVELNGNVTTFAGIIGTRGDTNNSIGTSATFAFPTGIAIDSSGNLYVADSFNHLIRKITVFGSVSTLAGTSGGAGSIDANSILARFNQPSGVAVDSSGIVYVADTFNSTIRKIATNGDVTTLAGSTGQTGSADGVGSAARFNQPYGIAVNPSGNLYIADTRNNTIRRSGTTFPPSITTQPTNQVAPVLGAATFTVVATGNPAVSYQWQRQSFGSIGFLNLGSDQVYSGATTASLTVSNVGTNMVGDVFRVIVNNGIPPAVTSSEVSLSVGTAPEITSGDSVSVRATEGISYTVTANGSPTPTVFGASGLPSWASINTSTGVISGTPPDTSGSPIAITITASNGIVVSKLVTITVTPALVAPSISAQPASVTANQGQSATFSVTAAGTPPLSYQWRRNGVPVNGATSATLVLNSLLPINAGSYSVAITNSVGVTISGSADLVVNTSPSITLQPTTQVAIAGSPITFSVAATGGGSFNYQWRKNGIPIIGATNSSLVLNAVTTSDVGNYDVIVGNGLGTANSSVALLTVVSTPAAPVITGQPANTTALIGNSVTFRVSATGAPAPGYQWRKGGVAISGATASSLTLGSVNSGDGANYDVVVTNSAGSVISATAGLRVIARSYAGTYFGSLSNGAGTFAIYVRGDNTGIFLAFLAGANAPVTTLNLLVLDNGQFAFNQSAIASVGDGEGEPPRAAALGLVAISGNIANDGTISGSIGGGASASLAGIRSPDIGTTQAVAGYYQAGSANTGANTMTIVGASGQAFVIAQVGNVFDGGSGIVNASGLVTVSTTRSTVQETITASTGTITGTTTGAVAATVSGASDVVLARQRLVNISSRARVGTGDAVAVAGFVISGEISKTVLIRAVGPTLGAAPFNIAGVVATPKLDLHRILPSGNVLVASNTGIASNRATIDAAGAQAGAFALGSSGADSALLVTLAPGNYTATVSSSTNTAGVALVEVYDLSGAAVGQKLLNISTRAFAGVAEQTLVAGIVIAGTVPKRVLIRGIGPGLAAFGLTGVLPQPTLTLKNSRTNQTVALNANWTTSVDANAITASGAQVGAFTMANQDSALIVTLPPDNYTAEVVGAGGATGLALIEVYELP